MHKRQPAKPAIEQGPTVTKATLRAAERLGLSNKTVGSIIGLSEATISRMGSGRDLSPNGQTLSYHLNNCVVHNLVLALRQLWYLAFEQPPDGKTMTKKRMVLEIGMGTDIRGADPTKAACRALRDALWHNSLSIAPALGHPLDAMIVDVHIGVPRPETVDKAQVLAVLPYGKGTVTVVEGGLEIPNDAGTDSTLIANACVVVSLDIA